MSGTSTSSKVSILELVYPPMSNQEAYWFQNDPEVEALLRGSDFYMIAGRPEAKFLNVVVDQELHTISLDFSIENKLCEPVTISIRELPTFAQIDPETYWVKAGEKFIQIGAGPMEGEGVVLIDWFTTEKLLFERWRGRAGIKGLDQYREFAVYDLLYVGIAKVGDSFDRVIKHGHKARTDILANEPQRLPGARVTDEIYLFLFSVNPIIMTTFALEHDFTDEDLSGAYNQKLIVADAEKAFVSMLQPGYNKVKFKQYPQGADSLYSSKYLRYGYSIAENLTLKAPQGDFRGGRDPLTNFISNEGDCIFVEGDSVSLYKSGVDYPTGPVVPGSPGETLQRSHTRRHQRVANSC